VRKERASTDPGLQELQRRREKWLAHCRRFGALGYDRLCSVRFVLDCAPDLQGPALDVGTGKGLCAVELATRGLEVVSIDPDAEEQALAKLLAEEAPEAGNIRFLQGDAASLPFPEASFGSAVILDALHHLKYSRPVLEEMVRVVRSAGTILLADFDETGFALVAKVQAEEGRVHGRTEVTVDGAGAELFALGCRQVLRTRGALHEILVVQKP